MANSSRDETTGRFRTGLPLLTRFMMKVDPSGPNGCWEWSGVRIPCGYGHLWSEGRMVNAHRVSYELFIGPIAPRLTIDHLCRNRACVNPAHLEPVTHAENTARGTNAQAILEARAARTHCKRGHPYTADNLVNSKSYRSCRICSDAAKQRYVDRKKQETA